MVPNMHPEPRIVKVGARELAWHSSSPVCDLTVIMLTQRIFERSGVADHLALQTAARDAADALR